MELLMAYKTLENHDCHTVYELCLPKVKMLGFTFKEKKTVHTFIYKEEKISCFFFKDLIYISTSCSLSNETCKFLVIKKPFFLRTC